MKAFYVNASMSGSLCSLFNMISIIPNFSGSWKSFLQSVSAILLNYPPSLIWVIMSTIPLVLSTAFLLISEWMSDMSYNVMPLTEDDVGYIIYGSSYINIIWTRRSFNTYSRNLKQLAVSGTSILTSKNVKSWEEMIGLIQVTSRNLTRWSTSVWK